VYSRLKEAGESKAAKRYWDDHPQLKAYMKFKEAQLPLIEERAFLIDALLPFKRPPDFREGFEPPQDFSSGEQSYSQWEEEQFLKYATGERDIRTSLGTAEQAAQGLSPEQYWMLLRGNPALISQLPDGPLKRLLEDDLSGILVPDHIVEAYGLTQSPAVSGNAPSIRGFGGPEPDTYIRSLISANRTEYYESPVNPAELERRMRRDFPGVTDAAFALMRKLIRLERKGEIDTSKRAAFFSGEEGIVVQNYRYPVQILHELGHAIQHTEGITNEEFLAALKRITGKEPWVQSDIATLNPPPETLDDPQFLENIHEWFATIYSLSGADVGNIAPGLREFYRKYAK